MFTMKVVCGRCQFPCYWKRSRNHSGYTLVNRSDGEEHHCAVREQQRAAS